MAYTFISGATGGIGKAFSAECAAQGYNLFLTGRSEEKLSALKSELIKLGAGDVRFFACDLTSENSRKEMFESIDRQGVKFDRIINVAGVDTQKPFTEYTEEKLVFQIRVNAEATICLTRALLERREISAAEIVTVGSMSGVSPMPYFAVYSATKSMLADFFTALRYELKKDGVKITVVMPGGVPTRQDIIDDIKGQGLWGKLSSKPASFVAERTLKAVKKNKARYIPGFFNKLLYCIIKIAPKKIVLSFIARRWKKIKKDAF